MLLNRREFLSNFASAGLALVCASYESRLAIGEKTPTPLPNLKDLAAAAGLRYGSDSDSRIVEQPPEYAALFAAQCAMYAAQFLWAHRKTMSASPQIWVDPNISFAREHGMKLTGGHLMWYQTTPAWMEELSAKDAEDAILRYIAALGLRFGKDAYSWNVVNEAIEPHDGRSDRLRKTVFLDKFGMDYFDFAAHAAKDAAPGVLRVYNDYAFEMDTDYCKQRRRTLLKLLDLFRKRNIPIQAVGLQTHLRLDGSRFNEKIYRHFLKEISDRGFLILITEMDVFDIETPAAIAVRDQMVGNLYAKVLNTALENQAVKAVATWGLSDRYTWLNSRHDPSYARSDGQPSRPLPFDSDFQPKPAFWSIVNAFTNAPKREPV